MRCSTTRAGCRTVIEAHSTVVERLNEPCIRSFLGTLFTLETNSTIAKFELWTGSIRRRDLQRISQEPFFLDDKMPEKVARYEAHLSPTSEHIDPAISGVSFLGTKITKVTSVTSTKRRDMFAMCPSGGRRPTFIFVTIVIVYTVPTNGCGPFRYNL